MNLETLIQKAIEQAVEQVIADEVHRAQVQVERRVKGMVTQIAANVCRKMSMEPWGKDSIVIRMEFGKEGDPCEPA